MLKKREDYFNLALAGLLVILFVAIGLKAPSFLKSKYLIGVMLRNIVELGMMALPVTLIIITGGIDLSVGSIATLAGVAGGMVYAGTESNVLAVIVALIVGVLCGWFNAVLVTKLKISAMVTTLATMYLFQGIARGITLGNSVYSFPASTWLGNFEVGSIPIQLIFLLVFAVIFTILLSRSYYGKYLYAIGYNETAGRFAGIDTNKCKTIAYILSGLMSSFAGVIMLGRFSSLKYTAGDSMNLKVVTIIVLGGTSINGGVGTMAGTIIAMLIIAVLNSGLTVLNIPLDVQTIVQGMVLMISLIAYALIAKRGGRVSGVSKKQLKKVAK